MKPLPDGCVDAVVTDPPYGIGYDPKTHPQYDGSPSRFAEIVGDDKAPDLSWLYAMDCEKIIWGAENSYWQLPHRGRWLCWYKRSHVTRPNSMPSGDFELAWMDKKSGFYKYINVIHGGCVNADSINGNNEPRFHPTQKPVAVMEFCIEQLKAATILDPFAGSGSTLVAAKKLGRHFLGFEISEAYCQIARERLARIDAQPNLFAQKPEQLALA